MIDIHSHILPDVDDGAANVYESIEMLKAAKKAGVTSIICTPHCRDPYFDFDMMWDAYEKLTQAVVDFDLRMGFEVNFDKLMSLDDLEYWVPRLAIQGPSFAGSGKASFLLELSSRAEAADFPEYLRVIRQIQAMGYDVVIAHPERYLAIQKDLDLARTLKAVGCKLQASSDFMYGGRLGKEKKPAKKMFQAGLYDYIASDAHVPQHYEALKDAVDTYGISGPAGFGLLAGAAEDGIAHHKDEGVLGIDDIPELGFVPDSDALIMPQVPPVVTPGINPVPTGVGNARPVAVVTPDIMPVAMAGDKSGPIDVVTPGVKPVPAIVPQDLPIIGAGLKIGENDQVSDGGSTDEDALDELASEEQNRSYKPRHMKTK